MNNIEKGIYRHYKGNLYEVIDIARHSESLEEMVVYRAINDAKQLWVRPLVMFIENVEIDGKTIPRFEYVNKKIDEPFGADKLPPNCGLYEVTAQQADILNASLIQYNHKQVDYKVEKSSERNYLIKDNEGNMIAGIRGDFYYNTCLYISILFVGDDYRKQGLGSILLKFMERQAAQRGIELIHIDTFAFQAKDFYLMHGYEIFGVLDGCPKGSKRYYFKKLLQIK